MPESAASVVRRVFPGIVFWLALGSAVPAATIEPAYLGSRQCATCHPETTRHWRGSHHDLAMQRATPDTVLGDFDDVSVSHNGITSRFYRRDDHFMVRTEGPGGDLRDFEIAYTFGIHPLQQYLIRFPDGRVQALNLAWDSRPATERGQRWFAVYGDEAISHDDVLHWTKPSQNWNHMCAECHSTNLRKGFDAATDSFTTTWSEIDVSCEACHGPGAVHRERMLSKAGIPGSSGLTVEFPSVANGRWERRPGATTAVRVPSRNEHLEIELCARCHSRRATLEQGVAPGRPIHDSHHVSNLETPLYHPDGQILDEVYVYGSFVQSAMYAAGVTCSDCHDPHSTRLRAEGNALCGRCHEPAHYDDEAHHHHPKTTTGARCIECHMPSRTYMQIDVRHDHSLRIPRPDLSTSLGTPNACNGCHRSMTSEWAARKIASWQDPAWRPSNHYGTALHAAQTNALDAEQQLASLLGTPTVPAIVRATAVTLLPRFASPRSVSLFGLALGDADAMVRTAAVEALEQIPAEARIPMIGPLLDDPMLSVRWEAARVLAGLPEEQLGPQMTRRRDGLLATYRAAQARDGDRAESHMRLASLALAEGRLDRAEHEFGLARKRNPSFIPAYVNLADLHRVRGNDAAGERVLRAALEVVPDQPDLRHALGLALVRLDRNDEALVEFASAARGLPDNPRYAYVYAAALHDAGQVSKAREALRNALNRHPGDRDLRAFWASLGERR